MLKILDRELFWPLFEKGIRQQLISFQKGFHGIPQHFAALAKGLFYNYSKKAVVASEAIIRFAHQSDDS